MTIYLVFERYLQLRRSLHNSVRTFVILLAVAVILGVSLGDNRNFARVHFAVVVETEDRDGRLVVIYVITQHKTAAVNSNVAVTFSETMQNSTTTQQAVRVFSQQRGGRMFGSTRGTASVSGSTVTFDPTNDFRPGETLLVTTTTTFLLLWKRLYRSWRKILSRTSTSRIARIISKSTRIASSGAMP